MDNDTYEIINSLQEQLKAITGDLSHRLTLLEQYSRTLENKLILLEERLSNSRGGFY